MYKCEGGMDYREDNAFRERDYVIEITQDLSPTLRPEQRESMHHMGGAAGESVYLYYEALVRYVQLSSTPQRVLSFGFGMGYNEILTVVFFMQNEMDIKQLQLVSHEKDIFLYDIFNAWLISDLDEGSVFDQVFKGIEAALRSKESEVTKALNKKEVKKNLIYLLQHKRWLQLGPVLIPNDFFGCFDVVFYDAFSSKTNGILWEETFLNDFFRSHLNSAFVFSTYACTGNLKRVAANNQSQFVKRDGFKGKRNSSMIFRDRC